MALTGLHRPEDRRRKSSLGILPPGVMQCCIGFCLRTVRWYTYYDYPDLACNRILMEMCEGDVAHLIDTHL